jgi:hypothetical protein
VKFFVIESEKYNRLRIHIQETVAVTIIFSKLSLSWIFGVFINYPQNYNQSIIHYAYGPINLTDIKNWPDEIVAFPVIE